MAPTEFRRARGSDEREGHRQDDVVARLIERHGAALAGLGSTDLSETSFTLSPESRARVEEAGRLCAHMLAVLARTRVTSKVSTPQLAPGEEEGGDAGWSDPVEDDRVRELVRYFLEANLIMAERLLSSLPEGGRTLDPEAELPEAETEVLRSVGASFSPLGAEAEDPEAAYEASFARLLATALDTKEAAKRLGGLSDGYVRQRLEAGTLYGVKDGKPWRLPLFQFTQTGEVPGIKEVLRALDPGLNPVAVEKWFGLPKPELYDEERGRDLTPREWLLSGNGAEVLRPLAEDL